MRRLTRRHFIRVSAAAVAGRAAFRRGAPAGADDRAAPQSAKPRERPNVLYALSTGSWGRVTPRGEPLPLLRILDETAASGFNGVRLTGFPGILERNNLSVDRYGDELQKRGLRFSTISFGGNYADPGQHDEIRRRARAALAVHQKFGATAMIFFPGAVVHADEEAAAFRTSFAFLGELGKMALEEYGVRMGLHNHTDSAVENQSQVDRFLEGTDPRYVFCAWDSAHLLVGGCDVVETYKKSIDRLVYTDFKDGTLDPVTDDYVSPNGERFEGTSHSGRFFNSMLELGRGQIDFPALMNMLAATKYQGWINHDLDTIRVSTAESWKITMEYITGTLDPIYQ